MDDDSPEDGLLIYRGSAGANRIKNAIDSKLHEQANDGPTTPTSPVPAANSTSNKETSYLEPAVNNTPDKEPISLATPSPVTTETTQYRK